MLEPPHETDSMDEPDTTDPPIRVLIVQPSLAKYRAPVYRALARRPGISLRVWYGDEPGITNVTPEGFDAELKPMRVRQVLGQETRWHSAQVEAARSHDVDVLVLSWGSRYLSLLPALNAARRNRIPTVLWGHGYSKSESRLKRLVRDLFARPATCLMFYDHRTADRAIGDGWPADRVYVAPNAIDLTPVEEATAAWTADPSRLANFRAEYALDGLEPIVFVSRLLPENRVDLLVEAVARLAPRRRELVAILVGDGPERGPLEELAERRGVAGQVRFLGAIFDENQLAPWDALEQALRLPSAIGLSLLHAFGYGLPAVTSADIAAQNPEIVALEDGVNGRLVPARQPRRHGRYD